MNARQFFDVWTTAVTKAKDAREIPVIDAMTEKVVQKNIEMRHGPRVAEEAVAYCRRLLKDAKKGGVR